MNCVDNRKKNTVERMFGKYVFQNILGMTGIWLAFPAAEFLTALVMGIGMKKRSV